MGSDIKGGNEEPLILRAIRGKGISLNPLSTILATTGLCRPSQWLVEKRAWRSLTQVGSRGESLLWLKFVWLYHMSSGIRESKSSQGNSWTTHEYCHLFLCV